MKSKRLLTDSLSNTALTNIYVALRKFVNNGTHFLLIIKLSSSSTSILTLYRSKRFSKICTSIVVQLWFCYFKIIFLIGFLHHNSDVIMHSTHGIAGLSCKKKRGFRVGGTGSFSGAIAWQRYPKEKNTQSGPLIGLPWQVHTSRSRPSLMGKIIQ